MTKDIEYQMMWCGRAPFESFLFRERSCFTKWTDGTIHSIVQRRHWPGPWGDIKESGVYADGSLVQQPAPSGHISIALAYISVVETREVGA